MELPSLSQDDEGVSKERKVTVFHLKGCQYIRLATFQAHEEKL